MISSSTCSSSPSRCTEGTQTWSFSAAVFLDSLRGRLRILVPLWSDLWRLDSSIFHLTLLSSELEDSVYNFCLFWRRSNFACRLIKLASLSFPFPSPIFSFWSLPPSLLTADDISDFCSAVTCALQCLALPGTPCSGWCRNKKQIGVVCASFFPLGNGHTFG